MQGQDQSPEQAMQIADAVRGNWVDTRAPDWAMRDGHFWLLQFSKKICRARAPQCETCPVNDLCQTYRATR